MSKSPNIFIPALGGTALVLGVAYGVSTRDYRASEVESLAVQVEQSQARVAAAAAETDKAEAQIATLLSQQEELKMAAASDGGLKEPAPAIEGTYGLGRTALPEEIAAWDVDVLPDGRGLPEGSGDVWTGEEVFVEQCASCHGDFAEGSGNWPVLAGGFDTLADEDPVKTIGSYWPYLSTTWDYINRSMPFGNAGSLSADDTYAIVAYILYSNDMVDDDFVLTHENFNDVEMHNANGFVVDDRAELEYAEWRAEPCMSDCKDAAVEITMRASVVDVTPEEEGAEMATEMADHGADVVQAAAEGPDPALVEAGEGLFRQCRACHKVGDGATNGTGPQLNGILGRTIAGVEGFRYSRSFDEAGAAGAVWDADALVAFLLDPRGAMPGTKMVFRGLKSEDDAAAMVAYLEAAGAQ